MAREIQEFVCEQCGKHFTALRYGQKPKYCSPECKRKRAVEYYLPRQRERERRKKEELEKKKLAQKEKKTISKINEIARKKGMSYGQYMALQYAKQVQVK